MLIVLEGIDMTGKTSLSHDLGLMLRDAEVYHFSAPETDRAADEYLEPLLGYKPGRGQNIIYDRAHVGELVWPEFFEREPRLSRGEFALLHHFFSTHGAVYVHCVRNFDVSYKDDYRLCDPPQPLPLGAMLRARSRFDAHFRWLTKHGGYAIDYDYKKDSVMDIVKLAEAAESVARSSASRVNRSIPKDLEALEVL